MYRDRHIYIYYYEYEDIYNIDKLMDKYKYTQRIIENLEKEKKELLKYQLELHEHAQKVNKVLFKKVLQLDLNNNLICEHNSIIDASDCIGIHPSGISKVCKGKGKSAGGFKWKYKE